MSDNQNQEQEVRPISLGTWLARIFFGLICVFSSLMVYCAAVYWIRQNDWWQYVACAGVISTVFSGLILANSLVPFRGSFAGGIKVIFMIAAEASLLVILWLAYSLLPNLNARFMVVNNFHSEARVTAKYGSGASTELVLPSETTASVLLSTAAGGSLHATVNAIGGYSATLDEGEYSEEDETHDFQLFIDADGTVTLYRLKETGEFFWPQRTIESESERLTN